MIPSGNVAYARSIFQARLGQPYVYGGSWSATNVSAGTDCSGLAGEILEALTQGANMVWGHLVSTESWPYDYATNKPAAPGTVGPFGTIAVASIGDVPADAAAIVAIHHGGGGVDSHMNISVQGYLMEDNGSNGVCTTGTGATLQTDSYWTDFWYLAGPVVVTTNGVDYSGGVIPGAELLAAGFSFACRYVTDGGSGFTTKQLTAAEARELQAAGVNIVSNWESTGTDMSGGFAQGAADAQTANANHLAAGGDPDAPIYFSVDYDAPETDQPNINAYFQGVASVIGLARTGVYGGYWVVSRLFDAGLITFGWQTEAWSDDPSGLGPDDPFGDGSYLDPRCQILQRNAIGYATVGGIQCDQDVALTANYGQWNYQAPIPTPSGGSVSNPPAIPKPTDEADQVSTLWDQILIRWNMLNNRTLIEAVAEIGQKLGLPYSPPA